MPIIRYLENTIVLSLWSDTACRIIHINSEKLLTSLAWCWVGKWTVYFVQDHRYCGPVVHVLLVSSWKFIYKHV